MILKRFRPIACNSIDGGVMMMEDRQGEYVKYEDADKLVTDTMQTVAVTGQLLQRAIYVEDIG